MAEPSLFSGGDDRRERGASRTLRLAPDEPVGSSEKVHAGLRLLGNMVRHPLWDRGVTARCTVLHSSGDVEVDGCDRRFDPNELEIDGERVAVPLLGKVE
jgi:hypothetical protein